MGRPKGGKKTGGREKGTPNKHSSELKAMIMEALMKVGGVDYLAEQAMTTPSSFLALVSKIVPKQVESEHDVRVQDVTKTDEEIIERYLMNKPFKKPIPRAT